MSNEPITPAQLVAFGAAAGLAGRRLYREANILDQSSLIETLTEMHELMGFATGSLLLLGDQIGCKDEVQRILDEGKARVAAYRACAGLEGRA